MNSNSSDASEPEGGILMTAQSVDKVNWTQLAQWYEEVQAWRENILGEQCGLELHVGQAVPGGQG